MDHQLTNFAPQRQKLTCSLETPMSPKQHWRISSAVDPTTDAGQLLCHQWIGRGAFNCVTKLERKVTRPNTQHITNSQNQSELNAKGSHSNSRNEKNPLQQKLHPDPNRHHYNNYPNDNRSNGLYEQTTTHECVRTICWYCHHVSNTTKHWMECLHALRAEPNTR